MLPHCNTPQHTVTHCNTLQHCNTPQQTATHHIALHYRAEHVTYKLVKRGFKAASLQHTATHRNTPHHTTPHRTTLQHTSVRGRARDIQASQARFWSRLTATHCHTLQHTTTHCTTPHRTTPHRTTLQHTSVRGRARDIQASQARFQSRLPAWRTDSRRTTHKSRSI